MTIKTGIPTNKTLEHGRSTPATEVCEVSIPGPHEFGEEGYAPTGKPWPAVHSDEDRSTCCLHRQVGGQCNPLPTPEPPAAPLEPSPGLLPDGRRSYVENTTTAHGQRTRVVVPLGGVEHSLSREEALWVYHDLGITIAEASAPLRPEPEPAAAPTEPDGEHVQETPAGKVCRSCRSMLAPNGEPLDIAVRRRWAYAAGLIADDDEPLPALRRLEEATARAVCATTPAAAPLGAGAAKVLYRFVDRAMVDPQDDDACSEAREAIRALAAPSAPQDDDGHTTIECAGDPGCGQSRHVAAWMCLGCEAHRYPYRAPREQSLRGREASAPQGGPPKGWVVNDRWNDPARIDETGGQERAAWVRMTPVGPVLECVRPGGDHGACPLPVARWLLARAASPPQGERPEPDDRTVKCEMCIGATHTAPRPSAVTTEHVRTCSDCVFFRHHPHVSLCGRDAQVPVEHYGHSLPEACPLRRGSVTVAVAAPHGGTDG